MKILFEETIKYIIPKKRKTLNKIRSGTKILFEETIKYIIPEKRKTIRFKNVIKIINNNIIYSLEWNYFCQN